MDQERRVEEILTDRSVIFNKQYLSLLQLRSVGGRTVWELI